MKRVLAMLLVLVTVCGLLPISALAATPDGTGPVLKSLKLEKTTVTAPGTIEVIADITDDISGVDYASVDFKCEALNETISCTLYDTYYDSNLRADVAYEDGKWHGTLKVSEYQESGTFKLYSFYAWDVADNKTTYYNNPDTSYTYFPASMRDLQFKVKETNPDSKPPVVKTVKISKTSLTAPDSFEVSAKVTDDNSGVRSVSVTFLNKEKNQYFSVSLSGTYYVSGHYETDENGNQYWVSGKDVAYEDGLWHGTREFAEDFEPGTYHLYYVYTSDVAGNTEYYYAEPRYDSDEALPSSLKDIKIKINGKGDTDEKVPPVLKSLTINKENVHAPGTIEVVGTATDKDSGVDYIYTTFRCDDLSESYSCYLYNTYRDPNTGEKVKYADGKWHGTLKIDEYQEPGTFYLKQVSVRDMVGNYVYYYRNPGSSGNPLPSFAQGMKFKVLNGGTTAYLYRDYVKQDEEVFVEVSVTGENLKYQWYFKNAGSDEFSKSSVTGPLYSTTMTSKSRNRKVYCVVTHPDGKTTKTNTVTLRMATTITAEPKNTYTKLDKNAKVTVKALGDGLKYEWYIKNAGGNKYSKSSVTEATYTCKMTDKSKDRYLYCIVTDKYGNAEKTKTVVLREAVSVTTEPKTAYAKYDKTAKVTFEASGDELTYQWYVKNAGADEYTKSSVTSATYSAKMSDKVHGRRVYCIVTDKYGKTVQTKTVLLRMAATITTQPKSVEVAEGKTAKVTLKAKGDELTYQWYIKNEGSSKFSKSSVTKATYTCTMNDKADGRKVYCVVTDKYGKTVKSNTVTLSMK